MAKQFSDVSNGRGAPMGRPSFCDPLPGTKTRLFRVNMVDGDYDDGGAYWGGYPSDPLYCALGDGVRLFVRALTRDQAKAKMLSECASLTFYR
jgi:hypothetical protein